MESFAEKIERMRRIFRGQESYGDGPPAEQATRYRFEQMMGEVLERAAANSFPEGQRPPAIDFLVSLSGFSPATTILAYELLRPQRVVVITSEYAEEGIDTIARYIVREGKLRQREFLTRHCNPTDPLGIYRIVKEVEDLSRSGTGRPSVLIDITGGKKVMSATAALAAWQLDLPLCYIESTYDKELRVPVPGTERLLLLSNPTSLFGGEEMKNAGALFRSGAYDAAFERYSTLSERIFDPREARFMRDLADLYRAWCDLDMQRLPGLVGEVESRLADTHTRLTHQLMLRLREQLAFLTRLAGQADAEQNRADLVLSYYLLGLHYEKVRRHDFAALLFYRTIEGCLKERLEQQFPGFSCRDPDYSKITPEVDELLRNYNGAADALAPNQREGVLPRRIGYMNAAALLYALNDDLLGKATLATAKGLQHLLHLGETRNRSVLAHGFRSVSAEQSRELHGTALQVMRAFWRLHRPNEDVDERCRILQFVQGFNE